MRSILPTLIVALKFLSLPILQVALAEYDSSESGDGLFQVAVHQVAVGVAEVHAVAFAVAPEGAVGAFACLHPGAVAIWLELILPYLPEIILIDIALPIISPDTGASPDSTVDKH